MIRNGNPEWVEPVVVKDYKSRIKKGINPKKV